jgi:hypothetical protein
MERRSFLKKSAVAAGAAAAITPLASMGQTPPAAVKKDIYELRIYQLSGGGAKNQLKNYLTGALMPYLNSKGCKVGIFSEYSLEDPPKLYVLCTYPNMQEYFSIIQEMDTNAKFQADASAYNQLPAERPLFDRYETLLLEAFDGIPQLRQPDTGRGFFELRIYESYNEDAGRRKVLMFNKEELPLFDKLNLNSVFFGKNIAGGFMPALTYMLWFRDLAHRNEAWSKFGPHPEWIAMRDKPEYANTVSKVRKIFLLPEEGSQI